MSESRPIDDPSALPETLPVSVIIERTRGVTRWVPFVWQAVAVTLGAGPVRDHPELIVDRDDYLQLRFGGLKVHFHKDEAADYYHNLTSPAPGCYIVAKTDSDREDGAPVPIKVTLSFDEANAYGHGELAVYHVPLPVDLYQWVERFVVTHYFPEAKRKRKLKTAGEQRGIEQKE